MSVPTTQPTQGDPNKVYDLRSFAIHAMVHAQTFPEESFGESETFIAQLIANTTFSVVLDKPQNEEVN